MVCAVWAYYSFVVSTESLQDRLVERDVIASRETIRVWVIRCGSHFARCIRRDRPGPKGKRHMNEVVLIMNGVKHRLWRLVDANGEVLDILVQTRRNAKAAKRFLARQIAYSGQPRVDINDKLPSYIKPISRLSRAADHRLHEGLNKRIEGSHSPTRRRAKIMGRFKFPKAGVKISHSPHPNLQIQPLSSQRPLLSSSMGRCVRWSPRDGCMMQLTSNKFKQLKITRQCLAVI